ncbi:SCO family protein [bacterium]|nr:MAG: SCO family protein [bacterium]
MNHWKTIGRLLAVIGCGATFFAAPHCSLAQDEHSSGINAGKQGKNNWDYTAPEGGVPKDLAQKVGVDQKLHEPLPLQLQFKDETGKSVVLGDYFGKKPVMITMLQMTCDQICSAQLGAMTASLNEMQFSAGKEFEILNVSIDPREGPLIAQDAKDERLKEYTRPTAKEGWHFLTGDAKNIKALSKALGIRYIWHEPTKQYIHPDGIVVATPEGKISRYFMSLDYQPRDLKFAVMEASKDRVGTVIDHIALSCFHYNPNTGKYSFQIMSFLRVIGGAFVLGCLAAIGGMVALEKRRGSASKKGGSSPQLKQA